MLGWGLDEVRSMSTYEFHTWLEWIAMKNKEAKKGSRQSR